MNMEHISMGCTTKLRKQCDFEQGSSSFAGGHSLEKRDNWKTSWQQKQVGCWWCRCSCCHIGSSCTTDPAQKEQAADIFFRDLCFMFLSTQTRFIGVFWWEFSKRFERCDDAIFLFFVMYCGTSRFPARIWIFVSFIMSCLNFFMQIWRWIDANHLCVQAESHHYFIQPFERLKPGEKIQDKSSQREAWNSRARVSRFLPLWLIT